MLKFVWIVFKNHCCYGNQKKIFILYYKSLLKDFFLFPIDFHMLLFIFYEMTFLK